MGILLLLPLLVSGYIHLYCNPRHGKKLYRFEGQLLYLRVAQYGLINALLSLVVLVGTQALCDYPEIVARFLRASGLASQDAARQWADLTILSLLMILVMPLCWKWCTYWWLLWLHKDRAAIEAILLRDSVPQDSIASFMIDACLQRENVMISMDDKKVYVGLIAKICTPDEVTKPGEEFVLIPTLSGYRDKDTLTVTYTTDYAGIANISQSQIYFRLDNVISICSFNLDIRKHFEEAQPQAAITGAAGAAGAAGG